MKFRSWGLLLAVLAVAWVAYAPGLHGGFLFDDFNNLSQLGAYGKIDNLHSLLFYLSSGNADPTGRPIALLSFLLDARDWPADPLPFKRTNILLHLLNGALLYCALMQLGRRLELEPPRTARAALLGSALWTLHPLFVSTTLYVVQREAMLPATFCLAGLLLWLHGTERRLAGKGGAISLCAGAWGCTALAVLSKANGALIPLLLLTVDWIVPQRSGSAPAATEKSMSRLRLLLLGLPSAVIAIWLASRLPDVLGGPVFMRSWSVGQRLLTEPRVICGYLESLWLPRASGTSVFNDSYAASSGWLHPWTTLPAALAVTATAVAGFALRRRNPPLALAILFYFAGHLMESTLVPLELYFEHRNYLPALLMFWPLALWLTGGGPLPVLRAGLTFALPLGLAVLAHARAEVWSNPLEQAQLLARLDPASPRAQVNAAAEEADRGRPDLAATRLRTALASAPDEAQLALNLVTTECRMGAASGEAIAAAEFALTNNRTQVELVQDWLVHAIEAASAGECAHLDVNTVQAMVEAMGRNPHYSVAAGHQREIHQLYGRLALARGDAQEALHQFNLGLAAYVTPDGALAQAALLGAAGHPAEGLQHLDYFRTLPPAHRESRGMPAIHLWLLDHLGYWASEIAGMRRQLQEDAAKQAGARS